MRGSLKCPSVPYLPQPFSQSLPNACIIFLAEVLLLPRATPLLALSPKNSALICSRTNLPRSRKARLPAPSSAQGGLGSVVPRLHAYPGKRPKSCARRGPASISGRQHQFQLTLLEQCVLEGLVSRPGDPRSRQGLHIPRCRALGFVPRLEYRPVIEIIPSIRKG